jgi:hypothetical protein
MMMKKTAGDNDDHGHRSIVPSLASTDAAASSYYDDENDNYGVLRV